jgi:hypothetical protein
MATSTEQYRQYPPAPANYPAQEHYQKQYQPTAPASPRKTSQNPPAHNRTFSFHSQKSHKSSGSKDLHETHAEKEAKRLHSTADPTFALNEAEPSAEAAMITESSYAPLRSMQHKDHYGNSIGQSISLSSDGIINNLCRGPRQIESDTKQMGASLRHYSKFRGCDRRGVLAQISLPSRNRLASQLE